MKKRQLATWAAALILSLGMAPASGAQGAFSPEAEQSYNTAVQGQDALDGLDVQVTEKTVSAKTNIASDKEVELKITGIKATSLLVDIRVRTEETSQESYYRSGYYYETTAEGKIKRKMDREEIWNAVNAQIYLDMTSNYLNMLYSQAQEDGSTVYYFAATKESLGDYVKKLLDDYSEAKGVSVDSLQGSMTVDEDGHVISRQIRMVYTVQGADTSETFMKEAYASFSQEGSVTVSLPDLSDYRQQPEKEPAVTLTQEQKTVYALADVNVRAAGSLDAAIIGGYGANSGMTQTGVTSDGWVQVQYNGGTGYVWGDYVSTAKPVITREKSGVMYATASVNVRRSPSADTQVLGVLPAGESVTITGITDNGWTRVSYRGGTGYIYSAYLTWSEPVSPSYVKNASVTGIVTDASYGSLTLSTAYGTMMFNTVYASMDLADTIYTGDEVTVSYTGSGTPYTALQVTDTVRHESDEGGDAYCSCEGVVTYVSSTEMEMTCSDGVYRTFTLGSASVETDEKLATGMYVSVTWQGAQEDRTNIRALAVS